MKRDIKGIETVFGIANQNNSGGYYIQNDEVNVFVVVEGRDMEQCFSKFGEVTSGNNQYCSCCGERWWGLGKVKAEKEQELFELEHIEDEEEADCIIHFIDGTTKNIKLDYYDFEEDY